MPTHNRANYIQQAVSSVLTQEFHDFEIVVVDDGSTDDTEQVLQRLSDNRIKYYKTPKRGAPFARNFGVMNAQGQYLFKLDSDDILLANALTRYVEFISKYPDVDVFYGDLLVVDEDLQALSSQEYSDWYGMRAELLAETVRQSPIPNPGACIRGTAFNRVGLYNVSFRRAHDYEWWSRAVSVLQFKHIPESTIGWRWHDDNMSATPTTKQKHDSSFEARVLENMIVRYSLQELFPDAGWGKRSLLASECECYQRLANQFRSWDAPATAAIYQKKVVELLLCMESALKQ
jgi:glycosyltransferase involved in cell wall biosynthesis